jgi:predicted nuclease of restriction endonuclease-like (RecB) superfamily
LSLCASDLRERVEGSPLAKLALKDEYTFDCLALGDEYNERQLEQALLARVEAFLREMGGLFTFLGRQYHLAVSDKQNFIE